MSTMVSQPINILNKTSQICKCYCSNSDLFACKTTNVLLVSYCFMPSSAIFVCVCFALVCILIRQCSGKISMLTYFLVQSCCYSMDRALFRSLPATVPLHLHSSWSDVTRILYRWHSQVLGYNFEQPDILGNQCVPLFLFVKILILPMYSVIVYITGFSTGHLLGSVLLLLKTLSRVQTSLAEAVARMLHSVWNPFSGTCTYGSYMLLCKCV